MLELLACALLGGVGRRVAGGAFQEWTGLDIGDVPVRIFFGLCVGAGVLIRAHDAWILAGLVALSTFLGCSIGNFEGIGVGRTSPFDWKAAFGLWAHGVLSIGIAPAAATWWLHGLWWLWPIAGVLIVPCYVAGWRIAGSTTGISWVPSRSGLKTGSEFGEFFWGNVCGLTAGVSLI